MAEQKITNNEPIEVQVNIGIHSGSLEVNEGAIVNIAKENKLDRLSEKEKEQLEELKNRFSASDLETFEVTIEIIKSLIPLFLKIEHWENLIKVNYHLLNTYLKLKKDNYIIIEEAEIILNLCEQNNIEYDIWTHTLEILCEVYAKTQNLEKSEIYLKKHLDLKKTLKKPLIDSYTNLAQITHWLGNDIECENYTNLALNEARKLQKDKSIGGLLINLFQIQHDNFKFKESLISIEEIEKNHLHKYDNSFANEIKNNKYQLIWKSAVIDKLNWINNVSLGNSFESYNGLRDFISAVNGLFLFHSTLLKRNAQLAFAYDFWGRSNYENILLANRYFQFRDNSVKVKIYSLIELKSYLTKLLLYNDTIIFLWAGQLNDLDTTENLSMDIFVPIPTNSYPKLPKEGVHLLGQNDKSGVVATFVGHYNLLPIDVLEFLVGEGKALFDKGYFTVIPMKLGGYIGHKKNNLMDTTMDTYLKSNPIVNVGDVHSSSYFSLPMIPNLTIEDLTHLLDDCGTEIYGLRREMKNFQEKVRKGNANPTELSLLVKQEILEVERAIKKANSKFNIIEVPYGLDFINLEQQLSIHYDKLTEINENLAKDLKKQIFDSPYLIFWKTERAKNKTWDIRSDYLLENIEVKDDYGWTNHWLGDTYVNKQ